MKLYIHNHGPCLSAFDAAGRTHTIPSQATALVLEDEPHVVERVIHRSEPHGVVSAARAAADHRFQGLSFRTEPAIPLPLVGHR